MPPSGILLYTGSTRDAFSLRLLFPEPLCLGLYPIFLYQWTVHFSSNPASILFLKKLRA